MRRVHGSCSLQVMGPCLRKAIQHGSFVAVVVIHTEVKAVTLSLFPGLLAVCSASFSWETSLVFVRLRTPVKAFFFLCFLQLVVPHCQAVAGRSGYTRSFFFYGIKGGKKAQCDRNISLLNLTFSV